MSLAPSRHAGLPLPLIAALLLVVGCSTASMTSTKVEKPTRTYTAVALGQLTAANDASGAPVSYFRLGFTRRLQELKGFDTILDPATEPLPPDAFVVSGQILEMSEGSRAARLLVGFGAGSARLRANFEIRDATGKVLAQFEGNKSYAGDLGIGGIDAADMNVLMSKFGAETAQAVWRWSRGQSLEDAGPAQ
jgi:uncharacterized protein DUF4410